MESLLLSAIIFIPFFTALIASILRLSYTKLRSFSIASSLIVFGLVLFLAMQYDPHGGMQFVRTVDWIKNYGISYHLGVDTLSLVLLLLVSLLMPLLYLYMWHENRKGYWYNMLLLQSGITGTILSLDLILFYLFWEMMLLPIYIMIGRYGNGKRQYNANKLLLMTMLGSMSMLFSILYLGYTHFEVNGFWTYSFEDLSVLTFTPSIAIWVASGFLLAFAIKIPLFGFHTWMAPAYGSSPTPAVVILSAIMAKLGIYGIWRFGYTLFEEILVRYSYHIIILALIGLVYYAIVAITQSSLRRMFAYASGSHLSLITLGLFFANIYSWGGSLYFIITHALASAGIFLMIGLLYKRTNTIRIKDLGGIASQAPLFAVFFTFFALSIAGVPGTGGFVAELLIIIGAFKYDLWIGIATASTMLLAMLYTFWMLQRTLFGAVGLATQGFKDLSKKEIVMLLPLTILLLITGIAPSLFIPFIEPWITITLETISQNIGGL